jgi:hypothetical protein
MFSLPRRFLASASTGLEAGAGVALDVLAAGAVDALGATGA